MLRHFKAGACQSLVILELHIDNTPAFKYRAPEIGLEWRLLQWHHSSAKQP